MHTYRWDWRDWQQIRKALQATWKAFGLTILEALSRDATRLNLNFRKTMQSCRVYVWMFWIHIKQSGSKDNVCFMTSSLTKYALPLKDFHNSKAKKELVAANGGCTLFHPAHKHKGLVLSHLSVRAQRHRTCSNTSFLI